MVSLKRVLAATDGSEHGLSAVVSGAGFARRAGASFEVISVVESRLFPLEVEAKRYYEAVSEELRRKVEEQTAGAEASDAPIHVRGGLAAPLITEVAGELNTDVIVVGAHPRPAVARFLVGSTAERIIRLAHRPVLVATEPRRESFRRILTAVDLSAQSRQVLETAAAMALLEGAELRALYVQDRLTPMLLEAALFDERESRHHAGLQFERAIAETKLPANLGLSHELREGHAGHEILHEAKDWNADLIVMGSHGFGFFNRLLLGSVSLHVLRHGHLATLVVPRRDVS